MKLFRIMPVPALLVAGLSIYLGIRIIQDKVVNFKNYFYFYVGDMAYPIGAVCIGCGVFVIVIYAFLYFKNRRLDRSYRLD